MKSIFGYTEEEVNVVLVKVSVILGEKSFPKKNVAYLWPICRC